jgi:hypothetical protein
MKKIIAFIAVLSSLNAFAINEHHTFAGNMGYMIKNIVKPTGSYDTKPEAIQAAKDLSEELQSGSLGRATKRLLLNSQALWGTDKKCVSLSDAGILGKAEREMARGRFEIRALGIRGGSELTSDFIEVHSYGFSMQAYIPCELR